MTFLKAAETLGLPRIVSIQNAFNLVRRCLPRKAMLGNGFRVIFFPEIALGKPMGKIGK
jgi:hypothetical protein